MGFVGLDVTDARRCVTSGESSRGVEREFAAGDQLPHSLVDHGADGRGEVERSLAGEHWEAHATERARVEQRLGQAGGFLAEDEVVATPKRDVKDGARGFGAEQPDPRRPGRGVRRVEVGVPGCVLSDSESWPVVEPGATARLFAGIEPEGVDEVQRARGGHAGPPDVARVVGDLGLVEDNVEERFGHGRLFGVCRRYAWFRCRKTPTF